MYRQLMDGTPIRVKVVAILSSAYRLLNVAPEVLIRAGSSTGQKLPPTQSPEIP